MFKTKETLEVGAFSAGQIPQSTTTESSLKKRKPTKTTKTTSQAFQSTQATRGRPETSSSSLRPTSQPEFVHMPTVKFDFGTSSFKKSHKKTNKETSWQNRNEIERKNEKSDKFLLRSKENDQAGNKIRSSPSLSSNVPKYKYSPKARFNDKDNTMFSQAASSNR